MFRWQTVNTSDTKIMEITQSILIKKHLSQTTVGTFPFWQNQNWSVVSSESVIIIEKTFTISVMLRIGFSLPCTVLRLLIAAAIFLLTFFSPPALSRWRHEGLPGTHRVQPGNQSEDWYSQGRGGELCQKFLNAWIWQSLNEMKMRT